MLFLGLPSSSQILGNFQSTNSFTFFPKKPDPSPTKMVEALPKSFWFVLFQNFNFKDGFFGMEKKNNKPPPGLVPVAKNSIILRQKELGQV